MPTTTPTLRHLLMGGYKGHVATMDWKDKRLGTEFHVREAVRDVQLVAVCVRVSVCISSIPCVCARFLHNEMLFAVAQKESSLHLRPQWDGAAPPQETQSRQSTHFPPYHFLLVSAVSGWATQCMVCGSCSSPLRMTTECCAIWTPPPASLWLRPEPNSEL